MNDAAKTHLDSFDAKRARGLISNEFYQQLKEQFVNYQQEGGRMPWFRWVEFNHRKMTKGADR